MDTGSILEIFLVYCPILTQ